jgi:hypothetical protein
MFLMIDGVAWGQLFMVGFGLNLAWEVAHCCLYETCRLQTWQQNVPLLTAMAVKDAFWITLFFFVSAAAAGAGSTLVSPVALMLFAILALTFSFLDEKVSVRLGRWEYAAAMPTVFGVGVTPLLELAVTGLAAAALVF